MDFDHCSSCGADTSKFGLMCDEIEGFFCGDCFDGLNCEELHGEGCATAVISS